MEDQRVVEFIYDFDNLGTPETIKENIIIPFPLNQVDELVNKIIKSDEVLLFMDFNKELKEKLTLFVREENQKFYDDQDDYLIEKFKNGEIDTEEIVRNLEKLYKEEVLEYADRIGPTDDEIFAQSFHRLVHSSSCLPDILEKEKAYARVIAEMTKRMETEIENLNAQQQDEMKEYIDQLDVSKTSEDINNLLARHYSTQNYVRKKWESELEAKRGHQKNEYREWVTGQVGKLFETSSPVTTPVGSRSSTFISQAPSMEESFTIHLGSQLKHMHNIRILGANIYDLCSPLHADESLNGLNMALGLYSSSLCGVVVLTPSGQIRANNQIIKNANMSTEFHFDQIDEQLDKIMSDVNGVCEQKQNSNGSPIKVTPRLKTGDFFITKHSNLSQSHVIFHLISDEPHASEINSRHPVILGLRNIMKVASRHDIVTLTIPALLRHEMSEDMTVQWCVRRAELIFKCVKGFMIESSTWGGAELSTLQFLLPFDISEELFNTLTAMVPNVFRVANPKILVDNTSRKDS
ncbi:protein C12orf4 homolog [Condylostylus longicornis]|uniref:protein C12orf4 homolog n=1 Tax=Condylostylus longicornis TaxID=2530218 RepID=UPI00244E3D66|nr:protein C12orf4 homolog [Condylostylus longicornis]